MSGHRARLSPRNVLSDEASSHRRILWATSVIGGATFAALVIGLFRNKAVALIGGPEAVGLLGLFTVIISTVASIATLGLGTSAVQQLSQDLEDESQASQSRWAILSLACILAIAGAALVYLLRSPLASAATDDPSFSGEIGWLSVGVAATVLAAAQGAVLQAYGRIGDLARVKLWGSLLATLVSVAAIYHFGRPGIIVAAIAAPIVGFALSRWFAMRLPSKASIIPFGAALFDRWRRLATLGVAAMLTYALGGIIQLAVRSIITREIDLQTAGLYHASEAILSVNLTLVLNAMAADYYPRLVRSASEPEAMVRALNEQLHVILLLAAPVLTLVSLAAPLVLQILYSAEFAPSALLLRLLVAAGALRILIFAFGFAVLARGSGRAFVMGEAAAVALLPLIWLLISIFGLSGAGIGLLITSAATCGIYLRRLRDLGIRLSQRNLRDAALLLVFWLVLALLFEVSVSAALSFGSTVAALLIWRSQRELRGILRR